jgi:hypothetical protein
MPNPQTPAIYTFTCTALVLTLGYHRLGGAVFMLEVSLGGEIMMPGGNVSFPLWRIVLEIRNYEM